MSTEELHKQPNDGDDIEILLKGLKKVSAPGDFDTRLRARIANYSASNNRSFSFGFLRFAAPAALVLFAALAGYFVLSDGGSGDQQNATNIVAQQMPEVEETLSFAPQATYSVPEVRANGNSALAVSGLNTAARPEPRSSAPVNMRRAEREPAGGGSEDLAATAPDATIFPPGLRPDQPFNGDPASPQGETEISVQDVFGLLGMRAVYGESGWRVVAAESTGAAGRAGVRVGDVIVSLGTTVLGERTAFRAPANISSIRVRRSGVVTELKLGR